MINRHPLENSVYDNKPTRKPPMKFVGTLRNHKDLLMNYLKANKLYSSGIVEGLNLRINLCMRKAYGYRSFELL